MLTSGQVAHFEAFGFLVLRQLFTKAEIATVKREAEDIFDEFRADNYFEGHMWEAVQPFLERRPFLSKIPEDDRIYNSAILIDSSGSIALTYRKTHETNGVMEKMPYELGNELSVVETPWGRVGILVCHDRWYPECYRTLRLKDAEIILNPVAAPTFWPGHTYFDIHRCTLRSHAYGNALFLACCNSADHGGHSIVVAPDGTTATSAGQGEEVLVTRLDPAAYSSYDFTATRRPMIY